MEVLENYMKKLKKLCDAHHVEKMYLFGSALGSEFNDQSDIDLLVRFKPIDLAGYFENYMGFKDNLKELLGRDIDLLEEQTLKNPVLIQSINKSKTLIYG